MGQDIMIFFFKAGKQNVKMIGSSLAIFRHAICQARKRRRTMTVLSFFLNIGENVSVACKIGDVMFSNSKMDNCHKILITLVKFEYVVIWKMEFLWRMAYIRGTTD